MWPGKCTEIRQYIDDFERPTFSGGKGGLLQNVTVNAVLAAYIGKAKQQDVRVMVNAGDHAEAADGFWIYHNNRRIRSKLKGLCRPHYRQQAPSAA